MTTQETGVAGRHSVGVDIGGTFIDIVAVDEQGQVRIAKVPSTPHVLSAIEEGLAGIGLRIEDVDVLFHGTTVATNALIQKDTADTLLVTTEGFRDVLAIRRTDKEKGSMYDTAWLPPAPIVPRFNRVEVRERIGAHGEVVEPLDPASLETLTTIIDKRGIRAVAVVLINSYVNPEHERQIRDFLARERPDVHVTISSDILPVYREFERTATTAANAYVAPVLRAYLDRLHQGLTDKGATDRLLVMQSVGGVAGPEMAKAVPAKLVRSGPAGGAVGLQDLSARLGIDNIIGIDIGGTSSDVSMLLGGKPIWDEKLTVEFGLPICFPAIDIISVGAGGGTVAWLDEGGRLRVGPRSAGSSPGPACYGKGGVEPTSTDAQVVLGRLGADNRLGGRIEIDPELARRAVRERIADPLGMTVEEAAIGILDILTVNTIFAVRLVTIERGYDPRDFALCVFGGSGGLYGAEIARELKMPSVLAPPAPGVFSASGMLMSSVVHDVSRTVLRPLADMTPEEVEALFQRMEADMLAMFAADGIAPEQVNAERHADVMYSGQTHSLPIELSGQAFTAEVSDRMVEDFHRRHDRRFGHSHPGTPVDVLTLRIFGRSRPDAVSGASDRRAYAYAEEGGQEIRTRDVYFGGAGWVPTAILSRAAMSHAGTVEGPAIVEDVESTTVVPPGAVAVVQRETQSIVIKFADQGRAG